MNSTVLTDNISYLLWGNFPHGPIQGLALTLMISLSAGLFAFLLSLIASSILTLTNNWLSSVLACCLSFLRAIPVLMLIFWAYFLLPVFYNIEIPGVLLVIIALSLTSTAYMTNSLLACIAALGRGQQAAGQSLGLSPWQIVCYILFPQAIRNAVPALVNQFITLIKDSSLAYIVNVAELCFLVNQVNGQYYGTATIELLFFMGTCYLLVCSLLDWLANYYLISKNIYNNR